MQQRQQQCLIWLKCFLFNPIHACWFCCQNVQWKSTLLLYFWDWYRLLCLFLTSYHWTTQNMAFDAFLYRLKNEESTNSLALETMPELCWMCYLDNHSNPKTMLPLKRHSEIFQPIALLCKVTRCCYNELENLVCLRLNSKLALNMAQANDTESEWCGCHLTCEPLMYHQKILR